MTTFLNSSLDMGWSNISPPPPSEINRNDIIRPMIKRARNHSGSIGNWCLKFTPMNTCFGLDSFDEMSWKNAFLAWTMILRQEHISINIDALKNSRNLFWSTFVSAKVFRTGLPLSKHLRAKISDRCRSEFINKFKSASKDEIERVSHYRVLCVRY